MAKPLIAVLLAALALAGPAAQAQAYPEKPISFIVPSPPGGGTDAMTRLLANKLTERLQWTIVVENRAGAGGNIGLDFAAKSVPDGHTIVMGESSNLTINPYLYKKLPFDAAKDVTPVALVGTVPLVLVAAQAKPFDSLPTLIAAAKQKQLSFASSGNGTVGHLVGETWQRAAGITLVHVPYKGAGPVMVDLLSGEVDMHFASLPAAISLIKGGKLRALAVTAPQRLAALPDVPTLIESGYAAAEYSVLYGVMAPAGTPPAIVTRLNAEINRALATDDMKAALADRGLVARQGPPEQFGAFLAAERTKWETAVKQSGATVD
ncbi:tripartite tricarboxylate transporter substrate binding protein [Ferrovibrio terrae]|uniref:Bug family tripartite tricarboxylate transporter substrate binding protein n=1 Tax=Ferrovibrio terrae TaxID=2594003 RepID=UPI00313801FE